MMSKEYFYSEIFHSVQGEGHYTGVPTAWLRFFLCNLQCNGFGQKDPTDESTYKLPYLDVNPDDYDKMEDLPVFEFGCDSSYSWSKKFKGMQRKGTVDIIADRIRQDMVSAWNPKGLFNFERTKQHMCFTGGEPLMAHGQMATIGIMDVFESEGDVPTSVTYETNGTQALGKPFIDWYEGYIDRGGELFFSCSPKLWSVAGEKAEKAIKPELVASYHKLSSKGQLKFVVNGTRESWAEVDDVLLKFRNEGIDWPVWIMPVGATVEGQEIVAADVATEAFKRGYNVSARVHTYIWGNAIGV